MCGDAKCCCKVNFDIREMRPAVDTLHGVVIVSCDDEVYLSCGVSGELVAVMCDVIALCELWEIIASCYVKCLLECM